MSGIDAILIYGIGALLVFLAAIYLEAKNEDELTLASAVWNGLFSLGWPLSVPVFSLVFLVVCGDEIVLWRRKK